MKKVKGMLFALLVMTVTTSCSGRPFLGDFENDNSSIVTVDQYLSTISDTEVRTLLHNYLIFVDAVETGKTPQYVSHTEVADSSSHAVSDPVIESESGESEEESSAPEEEETPRESSEEIPEEPEEQEPHYCTPQMYGAVGDGVTDDTDAINQALADTDYNGVTFPYGTYLISSNISIRRSNVTIEGGGSTLLQSEQFNTNLPAIVIGNSSKDINNITIDNLNIDGNRDNRESDGTVGAIYIRGYSTNNTIASGVTISNCHIYNCSGNGISLGGIYDDTGAVRRIYDCVIENCVIHDVRMGIACSCSQNCIFRNNEIYNTTVECTTCDNYSKDCTFESNYVYGNGRGGVCAMGGDGVINCKWLNNRIENTSTSLPEVANVGFTLNANTGTANSCEFRGNVVTGFKRGLWLKDKREGTGFYSVDGFVCEENQFLGYGYISVQIDYSKELQFDNNVYESDIYLNYEAEGFEADVLETSNFDFPASVE